MSALTWFLLYIVLWIVAFPAYLVRRADAQRAFSGLASLPPPPLPPSTGPAGWWLASDGKWYPPVSHTERQETTRIHSRPAG